jgi:hypothetical protein
MRRPYLSIFARSVLIISLGVLVTSLGGCGGGGTSSTPSTPSTRTPSVPTPQPSSQPIQHVVVVFQENRTPDNLFHGLPNADIADNGINSSGQTVPLAPIPLANDYELSHSHPAFEAMYDGGKMDGADKILVVCNQGAADCPGPNLQFKGSSAHSVQPSSDEEFFNGP